MGSIFNIINIPLGYIMSFLSDLFGGNFAVAVFAFTVVINLLLLPLSIKSQKSTVQQTRIKPKLDELKKRYGDDKQKYSEAMQKLYQEEGVSMSGGCLPMIVRLVLMLSIYQIILSPLTYMARADESKVNHVSNAISTAMDDLKENNTEKYEKFMKEISWKSTRSNQLSVIKIIRNDRNIVQEILSEKAYKKIESDYQSIKAADQATHVDYSFFGIDLTETPQFSFDFSKAEKIWIMPLLAFLSQILTSILSMKMQKKNNPDAPNMAGMMLTMPLISLFIGFTLPGGVAFYWACSSLIGGLVQIGVQEFYGPHKMLASQRIKELVQEYNIEQTQLEKIRKTDASDSTETN